MNYTFLHLSDLHLRPNWPEETELVLGKFFQDAATQLIKLPNPYLIFSGDLVSGAAKDGIYKAFLERMTEGLNQLGLTRDVRICVPGNHDVDRTAIEPSLLAQKATVHAFTNEELFNSSLKEHSRLFFDSKFEAYRNAEGEFGKYTTLHNGIGGTGWELPGGLGVYCLNTAICSFGGLNDPSTGEKILDKERLHIDTRSLHHWLQTSPAKIRILVMHHPLEWLADWARSEIENVIQEYFRVVLCGHIHRGSSHSTSREIRATVYCKRQHCLRVKKMN